MQFNNQSCKIYPESHLHDKAQKRKVTYHLIPTRLFKEEKLRLPIVRAVDKADTGNLIAGWWKNKC